MTVQPVLAALLYLPVIARTRGFSGHGDAPPSLSLAIVVACSLARSWFTLWLLETGYKLRH